MNTGSRIGSDDRVSIGGPRLPSAGKAPTPARRGGFSMVEVIIAILILSVGVLGLAASTAHIVRQVTFADLITERSIAFQSVIDRLQSLPYDSVDTGADSVGVFALNWSTTPDGPQSKVVRIWTVGPGMGPNVSGVVTNNPMQRDSFDFRVLRR